MSFIYDFSVVLRERPTRQDGEATPMRSSDGEELTIRQAVFRALDQANDSRDAVDKAERYAIANTVYNAWDGRVELRKKEIEVIKSVITIYPPLISQQIVEEIDRQNKEAKA